MKNKYPKLKYYNDWEYHSYKAERVEIKKLSKVMVREKVHKVFFHNDHRSYSEHGHEHESTVTSKRYFIKVEVLGALMPQYLDVLLENRIEIKVVEWEGV